MLRFPSRIMSLLSLVLLVGLAGCQGSTKSLSVSAVEGTFLRVAARHDAYTNADPALTPERKASNLRDTALLRGAINQAKGTAATQPVR